MIGGRHWFQCEGSWGPVYAHNSRPTYRVAQVFFFFFSKVKLWLTSLAWNCWIMLVDGNAGIELSTMYPSLLPSRSTEMMGRRASLILLPAVSMQRPVTSGVRLPTAIIPGLRSLSLTCVCILRQALCPRAVVPEQNAEEKRGVTLARCFLVRALDIE